MNKKIIILIISIIGFAPFTSCGSSSSVADDDGGSNNNNNQNNNGNNNNSSRKTTTYTTNITGLYSLTKSSSDVIEGSNASENKIEILPSQTYQTMDGFGAAITYSTAYNLLNMSKENRTKFLKETFSDTEGYGFSYVRVSIGCSDFSSKEYTCCDTKGLNNFSLQSDDNNYVIPILKEILAINPNVKVMGSPWTCPKWMKVEDLESKLPHDKWTDGHLNPDLYQTYSDYLVKWIKAYNDAGIPIYSITPQNEPLNKGNCASLYMPWEEEADLLKVLVPTFKKEGLKTKIYAYDHNYDQYSYPLNVYNDIKGIDGENIVAGAAFHNYLGSESILDNMYSARPDKELVFTETSIGTWNNGRSLKDRLLDDMEHVALGTVNRYCTAVIVWNLMLDTNMGPNLAGGCQSCYGAVDINTSDYKTISRNSHYYILAHLSSVVKPGAVRLGFSSSSYKNNDIIYSAFKNSDGTYAVVIINKANTQRSVIVSDGQNETKLLLPATSIVSAKW